MCDWILGVEFFDYFFGMWWCVMNFESSEYRWSCNVCD